MSSDLDWGVLSVNQLLIKCCKRIESLIKIKVLLFIQLIKIIVVAVKNNSTVDGHNLPESSYFLNNLKKLIKKNNWNVTHFKSTSSQRINIQGVFTILMLKWVIVDCQHYLRVI